MIRCIRLLCKKVTQKTLYIRYMKQNQVQLEVKRWQYVYHALASLIFIVSLFEGANAIAKLLSQNVLGVFGIYFLQFFLGQGFIWFLFKNAFEKKKWATVMLESIFIMVSLNALYKLGILAYLFKISPDAIKQVSLQVNLNVGLFCKVSSLLLHSGFALYMYKSWKRLGNA
jgi:hypothetical protein